MKYVTENLNFDNVFFVCMHLNKKCTGATAIINLFTRILRRYKNTERQSPFQWLNASSLVLPLV